MYKIIDESGNLYCQYKYEKEAEFERMVVSNAEAIFGASGIYFDMKRLIGTPKKGAAVPDGYYLDLTFHDNPRLYLVEVEMCIRDRKGPVPGIPRFAAVGGVFLICEPCGHGIGQCDVCLLYTSRCV